MIYSLFKGLGINNNIYLIPEDIKYKIESLNRNKISIKNLINYSGIDFKIKGLLDRILLLLRKKEGMSDLDYYLYLKDNALNLATRLGFVTNTSKGKSFNNLLTESSVSLLIYTDDSVFNDENNNYSNYIKTLYTDDHDYNLILKNHGHTTINIFKFDVVKFCMLFNVKQIIFSPKLDCVLKLYKSYYDIVFFNNILELKNKKVLVGHNKKDVTVTFLVIITHYRKILQNSTSFDSMLKSIFTTNSESIYTVLGLEGQYLDTNDEYWLIIARLDYILLLVEKMKLENKNFVINMLKIKLKELQNSQQYNFNNKLLEDKRKRVIEKANESIIRLQYNSWING